MAKAVSKELREETNNRISSDGRQRATHGATKHSSQNERDHSGRHAKQCNIRYLWLLCGRFHYQHGDQDAHIDVRDVCERTGHSKTPTDVIVCGLHV